VRLDDRRDIAIDEFAVMIVHDPGFGVLDHFECHLQLDRHGESTVYRVLSDADLLSRWKRSVPRAANITSASDNRSSGIAKQTRRSRLAPRAALRTPDTAFPPDPPGCRVSSRRKKLRIGYFDRSYDSANHKFGYTLATEKTAGSLSFNTTQLTTALSDPTKNDRWFSGTTINSNFPHPTSFLGDYSNIAIKPTGSVALWTDFRINVCFGTFCGAGEDAFYASVP
jgi:hypothetical protein